MITYVLFNQNHSHRINGKTFDSDCVAEIVHKPIESGVQLANKAFGRDYLRTINEADSHMIDFSSFSRGVVEV